MSHKKLFTMRDIARIVESLSAEEAAINPTATRYVKDYILMDLWPAVIKDFYPPDMEGLSTYTLGAALREVHLYDFYQYVWTHQWINQLFDLLETVGIDEATLEKLDAVLRGMLEQLFRYVLNTER